MGSLEHDRDRTAISPGLFDFKTMGFALYYTRVNFQEWIAVRSLISDISFCLEKFYFLFIKNILFISAQFGTQ